MGNTVDPGQILKALVARMQGGQGMMPPQGAPQGGIPGAVPQPPTDGDPSAVGLTPQQLLIHQKMQQQQTPGPNAQAPPQAQGQASQGGATKQLPPPTPTPFNGTFGDRRGVISQIIDSAEKRSHDKKVQEAMMYYQQMNDFLAAGDEESAHRLSDDPKIRKILHEGVGYTPLEEAPPPAAIGVHQAQQKIEKKQNAVQKLQAMLSPKPQAPVGRAIFPGPSQDAQQKFQLGEAKTQEQVSLAKLHDKEGDRADAQAAAEKQKADAETMKANVEQQKVEADRTRNYALADEAKGHATYYRQQAKDAGDLSPAKKREAEAHTNEMNSHASYYTAMAKYGKNGKLSGSVLQSQIKNARGDMVSLLKGYIGDNKDAAKAVSKDTGYVFGPKAGLVKAQDDASQKAKDMTRAISWFDGEGTQAITEGKMSLPEAVRKAYEMAGIEAPVPGIGGGDSSTDEPERPSGVPPDAEWDPETRTWSVD